ALTESPSARPVRPSMRRSWRDTRRRASGSTPSQTNDACLFSRRHLQAKKGCKFTRRTSRCSRPATRSTVPRSSAQLPREPAAELGVRPAEGALMRAIFSDAHGNLEALQAVLADVSRQQVTAVYNLGDTTGYGPNPVECLDLAMTMPVVLLGNNDQGILFHPDGF